MALCYFLCYAHLDDPAAEADGAVTLAEFLGRPAIGDRTRAVELNVRDMQGNAITQVGVELDPASQASVALVAPASLLAARMAVYALPCCSAWENA